MRAAHTRAGQAALTMRAHTGQNKNYLNGISNIQMLRFDTQNCWNVLHFSNKRVADKSQPADTDTFL